MYYEINVSHKGSHLFATHERSLINDSQAKTVYRLLKDRFPKSEGYSVDITYYELTGHNPDWLEL